MHTLPVLREEEALAITTRLSEALCRVGSSASTIHVQVVPSGMLIVARVGQHDGMCLVPHGHTVDWATLARALQDPSAIAAARRVVG